MNLSTEEIMLLAKQAYDEDSAAYLAQFGRIDNPENVFRAALLKDLEGFIIRFALKLKEIYA